MGYNEGDRHYCGQGTMYIAGTAGKGLGNILHCNYCYRQEMEHGYQERLQARDQSWEDARKRGPAPCAQQGDNCEGDVTAATEDFLPSGGYHRTYLCRHHLALRTQR